MAFLCLYQNQGLADVLLPLQAMVPSATQAQHTPSPSQSSPNPPSSPKAHEMCKMDRRNPCSQIWDWFLLWRATCTLGVAVLMTTFKFPEEHVPPRKGKFICSCQWSVFWAAGMAWQQGQQCPFTPSQIKLCWEGQERENLKINPGGKRAWEVTCSNLCSKQVHEQDGVCSIFRGGSPTTCRQSKIMLTWKNHHKLCKSTYQKHLALQTGCLQHREKLLW